MKQCKRICATLKQVRKQIADANGIPYEISECKHTGECQGTCPKCEAEVHYIENQLSRLKSSGKAVVLAGLSLGISSLFVNCTSETSVTDSDNEVNLAESDVSVVEDTISNDYEIEYEEGEIMGDIVIPVDMSSTTLPTDYIYDGEIVPEGTK